MGKFVISKRSNGQFQFSLKAGNGQEILSSESYTTKSACENGVESVRKNAQNEDMFDKKLSAGGKPYFNLKASNGQVIGTSEMYETDNARDNGIRSVMENAPSATVDDQS
ncbi:YegP family protein [Flavobacterium sp. MAH-1]|uniref:YegP family protein n=1 Tax=Flavobacterium agri TaxID=2743471 RepID=A0A7Y9C7P6_9FLAO|nr:YegP family protein [Flavobacterium agri]NUY81543.1 YegP family protein [Flavobacterium agri]NYA71567.1 YegP family protein [Flavobacterium agri]